MVCLVVPGLSASSFFFALTYIIGCTGEIPVALLRWKFVDGKTVGLKYNAGLQLPANIGELDDSVTKINLSYHNLRGGLSIRSERIVSFINMCIGTLHTGGVSNEMFAFLCGLERFDLSRNPRLAQSTLAGYLACTMQNLKDASRIDARNKGLKGEGAAPVLSGQVTFLTF